MARILGPFGIRGWVKVKAYTERPESLGAFPTWLLGSDGNWREVRLEAFAVHSKGPVAKLAGCEDREGAVRLRDNEVAVPRSSLGEAEEGAIFWVDLVGSEVVDEAGTGLGRVEGLFESGETSVLVVRGPPPRGQDLTTGGRERLIPFVPDYVKSVDRDARRITVDWKPDYDA